MFERVECPDPAYNRLVRSGLDRFVYSKKRVVVDVLSGYFDDEPLKSIIDVAVSSLGERGKIDRLNGTFNDILNFDVETQEQYFGSEFGRIRDLSLKYPGFLAYAILGDHVLDHEDFGFPSVRSLEESIVSFCIGEDVYGLGDREWVWRNGGWKNRICQTVHGDLYVDQSDVSGRDYMERGLFGDLEVFDTFKNVEGRGISGYQDWSQFLISILRYADNVGMSKIREIVDWREILDEIGGGIGTNTAECEFGGGDFGFQSLFGYELFSDENKLEGFPLHIFGSRDLSFLPYIEKGNLLYLREDENGEYDFDNNFLNSKRFRKVLEYNAGDIPEVLKANYKYFARDRTLLPKIMDWFVLGS